MGTIGTVTVLVMFISCGTGAPAMAQVPVQGPVERARVLSDEGRRADALALLEGHLRESPRDVDARLVYGLILSWEGRYDQARDALQQVLTQTPEYLDARVALMNVEWWAGRTKEAIDLARQVLAREAGHPQARLVLQRLEARSHPWMVGLSASRDSFADTFDPWTEMSVSAGRQTPAGSLIVRGSRADRFGDTDEMVEVEFYPSIRAGTYGFVGVGISPDHTLYPERRFSADLYQSLGWGVEVSIGYRQLAFAETTRIYVGTLTKYLGNWMVTGKVFHVPDRDVGGSWSYHGQLRRYFGSSGTSFFGAGYSYGISREDPRGVDDLVQLDANTGRLQVQLDLGPRIQFSGGGTLSRQERVFRDPQWQTTLSAGLALRF